MSQKIKHREFTGIIKSGMVGALVFTSISFIWIIVSIFKGSSRSIVVTTFMNSPEFDFAIEVLVVIVCSGFALGILAGWFFPIIQKFFLLLAIIFIVPIVPLGFGIWVLHQMWMGTELPPVSLKLADITNNVVNIHFKTPRGHAYRLDLKTSEAQVSRRRGTNISHTFSGHLRISSNGLLIADLPIGSDRAWSAQNGSWYGLTGAGIQNTNVPALSTFIQPHKSYDFEISFEPPPPPGSSVWLYCTVYVRDQ